MSTAEILTAVGIIVSIAAAVVSIIAIIVTRNRNSQDLQYRDTQWEVGLESRLKAVESQLSGMTPINDRVVALETKMGVFWNMVEHMSVAQLVHTTEQDVEDARVYDELKSDAPTDVLKRLGNYLANRLMHDEDVSYNEAAVIVLKLGAIQAQLIDRGEEPIPI